MGSSHRHLRGNLWRWGHLDIKLGIANKNPTQSIKFNVPLPKNTLLSLKSRFRFFLDQIVLGGESNI